MEMLNEAAVSRSIEPADHPLPSSTSRMLVTSHKKRTEGENVGEKDGDVVGDVLGE